jgi:hypothetical protein
MTSTDGFNILYKEAISKKYTLAKDCEYNNEIIKKYRGFNSLLDVKRFIMQIKKFKFKNYYEVITGGYSKFYFDFDKVSLSKEDLMNNLNFFLEYFNLFFHQNITEDDILIYHRDDKENIEFINSFHFIILKFNATRTTMKNFIEFLKLKLFCMDVDDKIYTKNRLFNLPYNTKLKNTKKSPFNQKHFIDTKEQNSDINNYLVSNIENTKKITIPFYNLLAFTLVKNEVNERLDAMRNAFNILRKNAKTKNVINNTKKYHFNDVIDAFDLLIDSLPVEFYNHSHKWKTITGIFKKYGLKVDEINIWNKLSAQKSSGKWTETSNKNYYDALDVSKIRSGIPLFKSIIEEYLSIEISISRNSHLVKWIENKTNFNFEDTIINNINKKTRKPILLCDTQTEVKFYYDNYSGFLYDEKKMNVLGNFNIECGLKDIFENNKNEHEVEINSIDDIEPYLNEFNNSESGIFSVKAKWGTGKTHKIIRSIINDNKVKQKRVIVLTENNALNLKFAKDFNFTSHIKSENLHINDNIVCSTESLQKLIFTEDDVLILDEYESLMAHFESDTFKNTHQDRFYKFCYAIQISKKVVVLDADLSIIRLQLISQIRKVEKITTYHIQSNIFDDYTFNMYIDYQTMDECFYKDVKNNKKIVYASSTKSAIEHIFKQLLNKINKKIIESKNILIIDGSGATTFLNNEMSRVHKQDTLTNLQDYIINNNIDVFLYSPTIKTGVSINELYFDKTYAFSHSMSVCAREFIQMIFRVRQLKEKEINIGSKAYFTPIRPFVSKTRINDFILTPIVLFKSLELFNNNFKSPMANYENTLDVCNINENYLRLKVTNLQESYNSKTRYMQDLMMKLIYNHNIKLSFIPEDETIEINKEMEDGDTVEISVPFYTRCEYELLKDTLSWREKQKYKLFYVNYFVNGITNKSYLNNIIYDIINIKWYYDTYYYKDEIAKYNLIKKILHQDTNSIRERNEYRINDKTVNNLDNYERDIGTQIIIMKLLSHLNIISLTDLPSKVTNKDYNEMIENFKKSFINDLKNYFDNFHLEHRFIFNINDKSYRNNIKKVIECLLHKIGVSIKYVNRKHTTSDNDKMLIYFERYNTPHKIYYGRLNDKQHNKYDETQVKKYKNMYKTIETNERVYKNSTYYTTYEVKINKKLRYLMYQKMVGETTIKETLDFVLNTEMGKYLLDKYRPCIIEQDEYFESMDNNNKTDEELEDEFTEIDCINGVIDAVNNKEVVYKKNTYCREQYIYGNKIITTNY